MNLISLGIDEIRKDQFKVVKNSRRSNKPNGGLWTSPIDSKYGWYDFVVGEQFRCDHYLNKMVLITLKPDAKILKISSAIDFDCCPYINENLIFGHDIFSKFRRIDFETLSMYYDGIWITLEAMEDLEERHKYVMGDLYGWDVETVLLFNLDCIESYA